MGPVTHLLLGATLNNLGFKKKGKWALAVILIASIFPDFDYFPYLLKDTESLMHYHRSITHSALAMFIVPAVISFFACVYEPIKKPFRKCFEYYYALGFLAYAGHLFLDLQNKFGVTFFAPLDWNFVSTDFVYSVDPLITLVLFFSIIVGFRKRKNAKRAAIIALAVVCLYTGARAYVQSNALEFARGQMQTLMVRSVTPMSYSITNWWYVAYAQDGSKVTGVVDMYSSNILTHAKYPPNALGKYVEIAKQQSAVKLFYRFVRHPHITLVSGSDGDIVVSFKELLYSHLKKDRFRVTLKFDNKGKLLNREVSY